MVPVMRKIKEGGNHQVMKIGELAKRAGVSVRAIRFYEELGLIQPEKRSTGGFRLYDQENHRRLAVITFLKEVGLSLTEIREIFLARSRSGGDRNTVIVLRDIFRERLKIVESKVQALNAVKVELTNALRILSSCEKCGHEYLLEALSCGDCSCITPRETVPDTLGILIR
jgi:MerR family transcriptional regulator, Zn(II)-responsive regulator of zntA